MIEPKYRRGDVWRARLDPVEGSEQGRTRPVVIIQNNVQNEHSPVVIVAAITRTTDDKVYPFEVYVEPPEGGLIMPSRVMLNQIRTLDKRRLLEQMGSLT